jgi:hypothetical protein
MAIHLHIRQHFNKETSNIQRKIIFFFLVHDSCSLHNLFSTQQPYGVCYVFSFSSVLSYSNHHHPFYSFVLVCIFLKGFFCTCIVEISMFGPSITQKLNKDFDTCLCNCTTYIVDKLILADKVETLFSNYTTSFVFCSMVYL